MPHGEARIVGQAGDDAMRNANGTKEKPGPLKRAREAAREAVRKATRAASKDEALISGISKAERTQARRPLRPCSQRPATSSFRTPRRARSGGQSHLLGRMHARQQLSLRRRLTL